MGDQMSLSPTDSRMAEIATRLMSAASELECLLRDLGTYTGHLTGRDLPWSERGVYVRRYGQIPSALHQLAIRVRETPSDAPGSRGGDVEATTPDAPRR